MAGRILAGVLGLERCDSFIDHIPQRVREELRDWKNCLFTYLRGS